ncbi:hypothetical protein EJ08DRAFT_729897 [Tothia fuscella]|uniref:Uncharacterized protein n=1 Tax=Tothia fuscella TaxID=1048955 RepID=A0A9P4P156_9PEZI|nr:hypothetical protein EJ08DRAFT_729897 [Tothia fuscella]
MAGATSLVDPNLGQRDEIAMSENNVTTFINATTPGKRKRSSQDDNEDIGCDLAIPKRTQSYHGTHAYADREASPFLNTPQNSRSGPDASSALFRKASRAPAKKYTRPPTKDVFQSLKIGTEEWVRLEAEAKAFMLDETHPERQASVGNRGAAPTNDTKIQLFKTVQKFLAEGSGDAHFGAHVGGMDDDRWIYPADEDKLIGLLTPLMRRMVTNERQRQYARRTRQSGIGTTMSVEPEGSVGTNSVNSPTEPSTLNFTSPPTSRLGNDVHSNHRSPKNATELIYLNASGHIIHRKTLYTPPLQTSYQTILTTVHDHLLSTTQSQLNLPGFEVITSPSFPTDHAVDEKVRDARKVYHETFEAQKTALQQAALAAAAQVCPTFELEVHGLAGLTKVGSEEMWRGLVMEVEEHEWMRGCMKVLVRVNEN